MIFTLIISYWKQYYGRILLNLISMSLSIGLLTVVSVLFWSTENKFTQELSRVQVIVGAKGSPLQLVLSSVFHIDYPTGNIPLTEAQKIIKYPLVKKAIPISVGDTYRGYRIVGTSTDMIPYYGANIQEGRLWEKPLDVVVGSKVAQKLSLQIGSVFHGSHGLADNSPHDHDEHFYQVVGILAPTGLTIDNLLLTDTASVWLVHHQEESHEHDATCSHNHTDQESIYPIIPDDEKEITALLLNFKTPAALIQMPKYINETTNLMAANPAFEVGRLLTLIGNSAKIASLLIGFSFVIACISVVITLLSLLQERQTDLALLRLLGATKTYVATLLITESCGLLLLSTLIGLLGGYGSLTVLMNFWQESQNILHFDFYGALLWLFPINLGVGVLIAIIPILKTFRRSVIKLLS